jgi:integrase
MRVRLKIKLTKGSAGRLGLPEGKRDAIHFDTEIPGFGLRFRQGAGGVLATWVLQHKEGRETLGRYPAISAATAREWATRQYAQIALGASPAARRAKTKQEAVETFEATLRLYLAAKGLRPRSRIEVERHLLKNAASLHRRPLAQVSKREVATVLAAVAERSGTVQANRTRASLSAFFAWSCRRGLTDANPVAFTERHKEASRDRVLSDAELRRVWHALPDSDYGKAVKLLILTGQRREEIGGLRWSEIDLNRGVISLPAERTKNGKPHEVPLSVTARAILEAQPRFGDFVFGRRGIRDWPRRKLELDVRLGLEPPWVIHDLRRTAATRMIELGVLPHVVEAVLNHFEGHRSGVAGVYNRSLYAVEKAHALGRWDEHIAALVEDRPSSVIAMKLPA